MAALTGARGDIWRRIAVVAGISVVLAGGAIGAVQAFPRERHRDVATEPAPFDGGPSAITTSDEPDSEATTDPTTTAPQPPDHMVVPESAPGLVALNACSYDEVYVTVRARPSERDRGVAEIVMTNISTEPCTIPPDLRVVVRSYRSQEGVTEYELDPSTEGAIVVETLDAHESAAIQLSFIPEDPELDETIVDVELDQLGGPYARRDVGVTAQDLVAIGPTVTDFSGPLGVAEFWPSEGSIPDPVGATDQLTIRGLGPVQIGMSLQQVADVTGLTLVVDQYGPRVLDRLLGADDGVGHRARLIARRRHVCMGRTGDHRRGRAHRTIRQVHAAGSRGCTPGHGGLSRR